MPLLLALATAPLKALPSLHEHGEHPQDEQPSSNCPAFFIFWNCAPATRSPAALLPYDLAALSATALKPVVALLCLPISRSLSCDVSALLAIPSSVLFKL